MRACRLPPLVAISSIDATSAQYFAERRVPAQLTLFHQLVHVVGRRTTGSGFEQLAALKQRHDREHTGAGPQLERIGNRSVR